MRTGARGRGFPGLLRSRWFLGLCLVGLLGGLSALELAGLDPGGTILRLLIPPADARKASPLSRRGFGLDVRRPGFGWHAPAFQAPAFRPPAEARPNFAARTIHFPRRHRAPYPAPAVAARPPAHTRGGERARPRPGDGSGPLARASSTGGWVALIKQAPSRTGRSMPAPVVGWQGVPARIPKARAHFRYLLGKLAGRTPRPSQAALQPARGKSHDGRVVEAAKVRQAPRRLGGRPVLDLLPPVGSFRPREVLAVNLSAEGLAKVRDGSYAVVEQIALPEFGLTITRLRPPEDLNAVSAQGRLFDLLPDDGFTLNHVYTPYRPGAGPASVDASGSAPASKSCPAERCFGSTLISWRPSLATCARDIKVGIIDTGFDRAHPAFAGLRYEYREFLPEGRSSASAQHGTAVLSLLAGRADSGTPGLIPDASYVIANAFFADDGGQPVSDTAEMLKALHWLKRSGAAVVNLSFAGPEDELVHHAVQELTRAGAVVVAAAGNDGPSAPPSYPAAYPEVIAVTAVDRNLAAYRYASRGDHIDLAAPGVEVWTAMPGKREGAQTGTSFAVPYVTAVVAVALPEAGLAPDGDGLAAKRYALAQLHGNVRRLGGTGRNPTYGDGLVQAPQSCNPPPIAAVTASADPPVQAWAGTVHRAIEPAAAAEPVLIGSWVSTVRAASADSMAR